MSMPGRNSRLQKMCAKGLLCETSEGEFLRVSHIAKACDNEGDKMGGLVLGGHQRRKSKVQDGTTCLSISTQSGLAVLEYTVNN